MMKAVFGAFAIFVPAAGALAQASDLWLTTAFGTNTLYRVQSGTLVTSWAQTGTGESGLAVLNPYVKTTGASGGTGVRYGLSGAATGTTYSFTGTGSRYDGTTDATYNYSTTYPNGNVTRYDLDWGNESLLFSTGRQLLGIAYDAINTSLWAVDIGQSPPHILEFAMTGGAPITDFPTIGGSAQYSLGWDAADNTLWTAEYGTSNPRLSQYTKSGTLLQQFTVAGLTPSQGDILGIDFDPIAVPAPGSLALLALGGLAASRRRA